MHKSALFTTAALILVVALARADARAQAHDAPKVEAGAQFSSLSITAPGFGGAENATGFGGRVTYNITDNLAVEAEGNFYPTGLRPSYVTGGRAEQLQFGVKAGRRFEKFGVFAKARPGLVSFDDTIRVTRAPVVAGGVTQLVTLFSSERKTHFSADVGGVLELYPSRRVLVRFDFGDTMIRYGGHDEPETFSILPVDERPLVRVPAELKHNFQFTAGLAYRFGGGAAAGGKDDDDPRASYSSPSGHRFEAGIQFSSLSLSLSNEDFGFPFFGPFNNGSNAEAGFGARLGYNVTEHFALEAEGNFFPRRGFANSTTGGYPVQMQFGAKVGKRYKRFGLFAKARPGFITFSRVLHQTGTESFTFGGQTFVFPVFEDRRRTYFSTDIGGVIEIYPAGRFFTRLDFGDTIIHYGARDAHGIITTGPPPGIPPSTRHNFQFNAGIGFRF